MIKYELSEHAHDMMKERNILDASVKSAMENPEKKTDNPDGTVHYIVSIKECGGRYLRVIVNPSFKP